MPHGIAEGTDQDRRHREEADTGHGNRQQRYEQIRTRGPQVRHRDLPRHGPDKSGREQSFKSGKAVGMCKGAIAEHGCEDDNRRDRETVPYAFAKGLFPIGAMFALGFPSAHGRLIRLNSSGVRNLTDCVWI